jgi:hypothetical protein
MIFPVINSGDGSMDGRSGDGSMGDRSDGTLASAKSFSNSGNNIKTENSKPHEGSSLPSQPNHILHCSFVGITRPLSL